MVIEWKRTGKQVNKADLDRVSSALGISLPGDYQEFLMEHNGGVPRPGKVHYVDDDGEKQKLTVTKLFDLARVLAVAKQFRGELALPDTQLPIGFADEVDLLVLDNGQVRIHVEIEGGIGNFGSWSAVVATSFGEFLSLFSSTQRGTSPNAALIKACDGGDTKKIRKLLEAGVDWTVVASEAMEAAAGRMTEGDLEPIKLLLEGGLPRETEGQSGLWEGVPLEEVVSGHLSDLEDAVKIFGKSSTDGKKTLAEIEKLRELLARFF